MSGDVRNDEDETAGGAVLGAGPAGLTSAYVLALRGASATVHKADTTVGGIAKTVVHGDYRFECDGISAMTACGSEHIGRRRR